MTKEDITVEFYFKKAIYVSPITGSETFIDIKDILTGEISNGWLIDRFQIEFEYDVNKYNL